MRLDGSVEVVFVLWHLRVSLTIFNQNLLTPKISLMQISHFISITCLLCRFLRLMLPSSLLSLLCWFLLWLKFNFAAHFFACIRFHAEFGVIKATIELTIEWKQHVIHKWNFRIFLDAQNWWICNSCGSARISKRKQIFQFN